MKGYLKFLITIGIFSLIIGILAKLSWFFGIIDLLPLGIKPASYFLFANSVFLLAIATALVNLLKSKE